MRRWVRPIARVFIVLVLLSPGIAAVVGRMVGPGVLHPMNLNPQRFEQTAQMLQRTGAVKEDFDVRAPDGVALHGWKIRPRSSSGDWVLLFHGVSDNRSGVLGQPSFCCGMGTAW